LSTHHLSTLSAATAVDVIALADAVLPRFQDVQVIQNRTGIVMLPYRDTAKGVVFHVGEVLMAEAHVRAALTNGRMVEGYGACLGRNTQHALAMAVIDAALRAGVEVNTIEAFVALQADSLLRQDQALRAKVETTHVEMETF
jgi:alpha-D-ribose 1-methylphosphonate 5-triphosphate synthase subunit PhnG